MNSVDNILEYKNLNSIYCSPPLLRKTAATTYDFPEQPQKKDKKWSLGSLFRRKKKQESDSSSEDEADRKGFLNRRRKKSDKRKKIKQRSTFDHVIIPSAGVSVFNGHNTYDDNGILSDPTGGFGSYSGRILIRTPNQNRRNNQQVQSSKELVNNVNASRSSLGSADSLYKNSRKFQVKFRAEARRETNVCASSSDEDSQKSTSSLRLKSDESINKPIEVITNKKSRAARTERYIRRVSKEDELVPGLRTSKSDAENNIKRFILPDDKREIKRNASRSPMLQNNQKLRIVSQNSGLSTIPPSHTNLKRNNQESIHTKLQKPPVITHNSNRYSSLNGSESKENYSNCQRSISYDADIHRSVSPEIPTEIIHAQLPLGKPSHRVRNLSLVEQSKNTCFKQPPPPPPRDPWRVLTVQHADHGRPMSYCFERTQRTYPPNDFMTNRNNMKSQSFNWRSNIRSTSEDHLPLESSPIPFHPRPSSATSEHPNQSLLRKNQEPTADQFQYLADKNPRSRKPIFIQSFKEDKCETSKSSDFLRKKDVQEKAEGKQASDAQKALDFWKQKEEEGRQMEKKSLPSSPQIFTASTHVRTNIFLPSVLKSDMETAEEYKRSSPFKPISPQVLTVESHSNVKTKNDETEKDAKSLMNDVKSMSPTATERKSSNLEDALDELEAIYNSLRLGDEDLLERAEERERSIAAKKMMEMNSEVYPGWGTGTPRGAISDSSFSYEPFDSVDSPKKKRLLKKLRNSDRKSDDMALRKLNKERSTTISDPKDVISKVSYLLASPLHGLSDDVNIVTSKNHKEPDVTYDDVVFRTIKHANNTLKVSDPQPPFGIPMGPILPACNSDYLHAAPDETPKYTAKNKKIPDIVKDDLAYRNLRKDNNKEPVLPPFINEDLVNNNNNPLIAPLKPSYSSIKKKRAVRSLSANIYNLIQNEPFVLPFSEETFPEKPKEKTSLDDIADAMEIARQILKEKEEKISATRRAFLSDTETRYKKNEAGNSYLAECRKNFLNNMKCKESENDHKNDVIQMDTYVTSKPPRGMTPDKKATKESSLSPSDVMKVISYDNKIDNSSSGQVSQTSCDDKPCDSEVILITNNDSNDNNQNLKETSPPISALNNTGHQRSSLEDLLTAFAVEAQEASRRIADELKQLEKNINFNKDHIEESPKEPTVLEEIKCFDETTNRESFDNNIGDIEKVATAEMEAEIMEETEGLSPQAVSLANIVQTRSDFINVNEKPIITEVHSDSDHDYVNMGSDAEIEKAIPLIDESANDSPSCKSPYEEKKADLIAGFQELKKVGSDSELHVQISSSANASGGKDNGGNRGDYADDQRGRAFELSHRYRSLSCGRATELTTMSEANEETSAQRIARYKEERHKQYSIRYERLLAQNKLQLEQLQQQKRGTTKDANSSASEGPRLNRASRFRAAATAGQDAIKERVAVPPVTGTQPDSLNKYEKDKSSKRKSNLNRSLTSEEVPPNDALDDAKSRRRRRRFFPPDVLQQTASHSSYSNEERFKSDTSYTAYNFSPLSSPITATATTTRTSPKRSQLSVHMENARRSVTSSADIGKVSRSSPRSSVTSSPKVLTPKLENSKSPIGNSISLSNGNVNNKENVKRKHNDALVHRLSPCKKVPTATNNEKGSERFVYKNEKLQELLDLTKETLARVEKLTSKTKPTPRKSPDRKPKNSRTKSSSDSGTDTKEKTKKREDKSQNVLEGRPQNHSILKKKFLEEHEPTVHHPTPSGPVSILKRKVSQDDCKPSTSSTHTPPVTFSPSVVEPSSNSRKQGILKKRRSLDESQVMRHRSCSPDVANKLDSRSILKSQRRSSLEEITRIRSPDLQIQGILKRKTAKSDEDPENSLNSPQSILKRRSGASSAGSTSSNQHVSITTAVILAAAGGAEMILEPNDHVKPILKKKSIEEQTGSDMSCETLKPILKKKSSTDTDDAEDKPKPILKLSKGLSEHSDSDTTRYNYRHGFQLGNDSGSECEVKPILKQSNSTEESSRFRLSFHTDEETNGDLGKRIRARRSEPICTDLNSNASRKSLEPDRDLRRPRPISVSELVMNFEKSTPTSTGAIPKKSSLKRNDRSRTQPVTFNEIEASLSFVQKPSDDFTKTSLSSNVARKIENNSAQSLFDLTTSSCLDDDSRASLLTTSITNVSIDSGVGKMSSDSAFQSLGDGLELEDDESPPPSIPLSPTKLDVTKLQMKAIVEEAKKMKLGKGNSGIEKYRNRQSGSSAKTNAQRYSTQPITFDEVQEASKLNRDTESEKDEAEPSKLSLSDRIKMFNTKVTENNFLKRDVPKRRQTRFQTQPVTSEEVESARCVSPDNLSDKALDQEYPSFAERKGILKSKLESCGVFKYPYERHPRSALKHSESLKTSRGKLSPKSILKPESTDFTYDEGISSNDSSSDSENSFRKSKSDVDDDLTIRDDVMIGGRFAHVNIEKSPKSSSVSCSETHTSDESSGGREIRSIIAGEAAAKRRQRERNNDGLFKSRSHAHVGDDLENTSSRVRRSMTQAAMPRTIGELQAKLKQSGDTDWRKRIPKLNNANEELSLLKVKNIYNEELSEKTSILAAKKDELSAASKHWKTRVEKTDVDKFSVAGRMEKLEKPVITINIPTPDKEKRTPKAKRFKGRDGDNKEPHSGSVSPEEVGVTIGFKRSISVPGNKTNDDSSGSDNSLRSSGRKVRVLKPDDDTFTSFFKTSEETNTVETFDLSLNDLDVIDSHKLLSNKKIVKVQRRREASKNPLRALATRSDIVDEYLEITTDIAERELKRLNVEKLSKSSSFALEALAGLASKEDFSSILLKKCGQSSNFSYLPYRDLMLIHIKGRRHVQTRLVNPTATSINQGDNYILITPNALYNYVGPYSNVIEQSRACDIVNHIQQTGDMGCKVDKCIVLNPKKNSSSSDFQKFWKILGTTSDIEVTTAGHPDEDEIYESSVLSTNMIYTIENNELVPVDEYWGKIPKIEMLQPKKVYVFDFGSEMYVWSGITAPPDNKKRALSLAKELWSEGYNYSDCGISPINIAEMIGDRKKDEPSLKSEERPEWALFAKLTQHRETVLFREKFLDWPDYSRVIKVKQTVEKNETPTDINPCDVKQMRDREYSEPDFQIEGTHLGRGHCYFDEESRRQSEISTLGIKCWKILENTYEEVGNDLLGHFYEAETYVIRWQFRVTVSGRELSGKPSKHNQTGRDRCLYFCWLGNQATINEKGAAALLTVELDSENARQIRVPQGSEQPVFFRLFNGEMVTHIGKSDNIEMKTQKLYMSKGEITEEASLLEVPCSMRSLRSRSSFILVNSESDTVTVWHGCKSLEQTRKITITLAASIVEKKSSHFGLQESDCDKIEEIEEGRESSEFLQTLGDKRLYMSLLLSAMEYKMTPKLFHFSSVLGSFTATEMLCPYRSRHNTPYPFLQSDLYSASQPALFLLDNGHELWLWQGWWPEREDDTDLSEQTGSGRVRWQAERKAAMQTAINYWKEERKGNSPVAVYSVWAGLEPLTFTNLFPTWCDRDDIAELNIKDGKKAGETISVETELALLTRTTYPVAQLLQRPLPEGVDPRQLEVYLSPEDFSELLSMTPADFQKLPAWKQTAIKKEKGLF